MNCHDRFDEVWSMIKTRHDNDMTDHRGVIYVEVRVELSWSIRQDVVNHEN